MESSLLLPDVDDGDTAGFWDGTAAGELRVQVCRSCGRWRMPPRPMCPTCQSVEVTWVATSGRGTVWSFIVAHPPLLPAYAALAPYNAIIVQLDDDPSIRFVGNLIADETAAINSIDPTTIEIGEPVTVVFQRVDDVSLPRWVRR
jgi:uncharacterized OB-fold protein